MYHDQTTYHTQSGSNVHLSDHDLMHHGNNGQYHPHAHEHPHAHNHPSTHNAAGDEAMEQAADDSNNGVEGVPAKKKRKKVSHACLYCRRSHMVCDEGRPCQRCIKRDIGHLCRDELRPATGRQAPTIDTGSSSAAPAPAPSYSSQVSVPQTVPLSPFPFPVSSNMSPTRVSSSPITNMGHSAPPPHPTNQQWPGMHSQPPQPPVQQQQQQQQQNTWGSETLGNEFSVLTEFLESLDDRSFFGAPSNNSAVVPATHLPTSMNADRTAQNQQQRNPQPISLGPLSHNGYPGQHSGPGGSSQQAPPPNAGAHQQHTVDENAARMEAEAQLYAHQNPVSMTEKFFMTAADQATGTRDERLATVIKAKYEAGLLKPYNYVKGYKRLSTWMEQNVSPDSRQAIQQPLAMLRPKFRSVAQNLTDMDLVFIEEAFERLLLDYDRVFSAMGIPACLWRRTGEIYKGNREFATLIGVNVTDLVDGRLAIYELMSEESAVNFWEKYGTVAFDTGQKAVLTSCVLRYKPRETRQLQNGPMQERFVNCCFSFTIRRDQWGIPVCIVGNFISY